MGTYFDKKKLLEENGDLYISPYDKNLDYGALSQIIDAKKSYKSAEKSGDTEGMKKANEKANSVRKSSGRYTGGEDGSEYNREYEDYEIKRPKTYSSKYADEKKKTLSLISDRDEFSYSPESDPLYKIYRQIYLSLGDDAYERALFENALRTGGTVSTSAQSAAMQAKNEYNSMLAQKVPELYEIAYDKYKDETDSLYKRLDALSKLDDEEYSRYRDSVDDFEADRDYFYKADKDYSDSLYDIYKYDTDLEYKLERDSVNDAKSREESDYKKLRDLIEDGKWEKEFDRKKTKDVNDYYSSKLQTAVNLAKALYGKTPLNANAVRNILAVLN